MLYKTCSVLYLISGILIALGGFGHSFGAVAQIHQGLKTPGVDPHIVRLILAVWHFAGAAMVALGILVVADWIRTRSDKKPTLRIAVVVSLFYVTYGLCALAWMREPFWAIFVVYGVMTGAAAMGQVGTRAKG